MADGDPSHAGYRSFKQITRDRLLQEMLRSTRNGRGASEWKVLIMDELTVKIMSFSCKMADITDEGVSLVEDLNKRRQPLPALDAVYFIQPSRESIKKFVADMAGSSPLYKRAYVFFSSPVTRDLLQMIKGDSSLLPRIAALREMNLEYLTVDAQAFTTDNDRALEQLFGEHSEDTRDYDTSIDTIARRLATIFASLKEFPLVRYRAARSAAVNASTATTACDLIPTKLAASLWDRLMKYKSSLLEFPKSETSELIIVDRSIDPVAPVIHEWTYDAMCHDLLQMDGNKYLYETNDAGKKEQKEVLLEEHDPVWLELRYLHIADVGLRLNEKMTQFGLKNKAAQVRLGGRNGQDLSTRDIQKMVQDLPQYRDQVDKLGLHIHIATLLNDKIKEQCLSDIGTLEQDLAFGDASSKELINILNTREDISRENKLRLLMIYAAAHPNKLDSTKRSQWMKLARLTDDDMRAINNLEFLGVSVSKKQSGGFSLKFGPRKSKRPIRKEKNQDEGTWLLSRFYPIIQDVLEELAKGDLSQDEYPYVKEPSSSSSRVTAGEHMSSRPPTAPSSKPAQSMRTSRPTSTWASKSRASDDGYSSDSVLKTAFSDPKISGKRIFIFVVGGITRSELRVAHKLTAQFKREVVIGSTSIDDPPHFITLKLLSELDELDF
ncbi:hypothetical protein O6H91_03G125500 [Diphasiastrum complanatum]|uniref:Uncharacterized protein n=1 Tax=Diphasiastrum complanatum TaxID=34168 RepID=A0ACC2EBD8_DIPCM|nr:hypothetical protein O6H91_03G125500 [Diphasiastrum complanatum]